MEPPLNHNHPIENKKLQVIIQIDQHILSQISHSNKLLLKQQLENYITKELQVKNQKKIQSINQSMQQMQFQTSSQQIKDNKLKLEGQAKITQQLQQSNKSLQKNIILDTFQDNNNSRASISNQASKEDEKNNWQSYQDNIKVKQNPIINNFSGSKLINNSFSNQYQSPQVIDLNGNGQNGTMDQKKQSLASLLKLLPKSKNRVRSQSPCLSQRSLKDTRYELQVKKQMNRLQTSSNQEFKNPIAQQILNLIPKDLHKEQAKKTFSLSNIPTNNYEQNNQFQNQNQFYETPVQIKHNQIYNPTNIQESNQVNFSSNRYHSHQRSLDLQQSLKQIATKISQNSPIKNNQIPDLFRNLNGFDPVLCIHSIPSFVSRQKQFEKRSLPPKYTQSQIQLQKYQSSTQQQQDELKQDQYQYQSTQLQNRNIEQQQLRDALSNQNKEKMVANSHNNLSYQRKEYSIQKSAKVIHNIAPQSNNYQQNQNSAQQKKFHLWQATHYPV